MCRYFHNKRGFMSMKVTMMTTVSKSQLYTTPIRRFWSGMFDSIFIKTSNENIF